MRLTVHEFISLDGVIQGPGGPGEDPSNGFTAGGWVAPYVMDDDFGEVVNSWFARAGAVLFGRTTFELMRSYWPEVDPARDPVAAALHSLLYNSTSPRDVEECWI